MAQECISPDSFTIVAALYYQLADHHATQQWATVKEVCDQEIADRACIPDQSYAVDVSVYFEMPPQEAYPDLQRGDLFYGMTLLVGRAEIADYRLIVSRTQDGSNTNHYTLAVYRLGTNKPIRTFNESSLAFCNATGPSDLSEIIDRDHATTMMALRGAFETFGVCEKPTIFKPVFGGIAVAPSDGEYRASIMNMPVEL